MTTAVRNVETPLLRADLEWFWPSRRPDAFDVFCR